MKLTAESTVINDNKLNTNIDNAQTTADAATTKADNAQTTANNAQTAASQARAVADSAQDTAGEALIKANGSVITDTLHYLATSLSSGVTTSTPGWTTTPQTITPDKKYLWTYHTYTKADGTTTDSTPVITGTYGEDGTSVTILGSYNTLAELEQAHPTGNTGDAYMVAGDLYVWNGSAWEDVGQIQGPQGPQGPQGETGVGIATVQPQYYLSDSPATTTGGSWTQTLTYVSGKYIWTREQITYTNSTVRYSTAIYNGALTTACENSESALQIASDTAQYFWFTSSGTDTGAHISETPQAQFISSPSGGNLLARSNGIAIRDGLEELATFSANGVDMKQNGSSVANFGETSARVGKVGANNVTITQSSIAMTDGTRTLYEVINASSGSVKITQVYNVTVTQDTPDFTDTIGLGRTVSSWVSQGIVLTYKLNGTTQTPVKFSSMPINVTSGRYIFKASLSGTTVSITWSCPIPSTDKLTLVSIELNFNTSQQVVESTLGAFADKTQSGAFRVGKGTGTGAKANAMLLDWNGNARLSGDVVVGCNADSSGGMSLSRPYYVGGLWYEASNGVVSIEAYRVGKVVMLYIYCEKTSSTSAGGTVYEISLAGSNIPVPYKITNGSSVTGVAYYGNHAIVCSFDRDEESGSASDPISQCTLAIKNASPSSVTLTGAINCSMTYICE